MSPYDDQSVSAGEIAEYLYSLNPQLPSPNFMSKQTTITGASDDLLEFDGHLYEEFYIDGKNGLLEFSDGTKLRVNYGKAGIWRFTVEYAGPAFVGIVPCPCPDGEDEYTDTATMNQVDWAKYTEGKRIPQRVYAKGIKNPVKEIAKLIRGYDENEAAELILAHIEQHYTPRVA